MHGWFPIFWGEWRARAVPSPRLCSDINPYDLDNRLFELIHDNSKSVCVGFFCSSSVNKVFDKHSGYSTVCRASKSRKLPILKVIFSKFPLSHRQHQLHNYGTISPVVSIPPKPMMHIPPISAKFINFPQFSFIFVETILCFPLL